jgi:hypothetical protein
MHLLARYIIYKRIDAEGLHREDTLRKRQGTHSQARSHCPQVLQQGLRHSHCCSQDAQPCSLRITQGSHGPTPRYCQAHKGSYHEEANHGVFVVTDVIYLPVESSETRVTADDETYTLIAGSSGKTQPTPSTPVASTRTISWDGITLTPASAAGSPASTSTRRNSSR